MSPGEQQKLKLLPTSSAHVFALDPSKLGTTDLVMHSINTGEHKPIL